MYWISFAWLLYKFPTSDFIFFFAVKNCPPITGFQLCLVLFLFLKNLLDSLIISFLFPSELSQFPFHFGYMSLLQTFALKKNIFFLLDHIIFLFFRTLGKCLSELLSISLGVILLQIHNIHFIYVPWNIYSCPLFFLACPPPHYLSTCLVPFWSPCWFLYNCGSSLRDSSYLLLNT